MPHIRYMSWNVQNYGQNTAFYSLLKGANSFRLARFIARLVNRYSIDILGVMEVTPTAYPHLVSLVQALNNVMGVTDWCFDWVKGSVDNNLPASAVNAPGNLTWKSGMRQEGYAFFWRNGSADFTMLRAEFNMSEGARRLAAYAPAYFPGNAVSLSLMGRDIVPSRGGSARPRPSTNVNPAAVNALDFDYAYYPDVSKNVGAWSVFWSEVRRPAYVMIRMTMAGTNAQKVVPIVLFHAPSNQAMAKLGTFICGLARELYAVKDIDVNRRPTGALIHPLKFIASGDYNARVSTTDTTWANFYYSFYNGFAATVATNPAGGANGTAMYDNTAPIATTVQIQQFNNGLFNGPPILGANPNDYSFSSIDDMFRRGLTLHGGSDYFVWDLVTEVMAGHADIVLGIQAYAAGLNAIAAGAAGGVDAAEGPLDANGDALFGFFTDWNAFIADVNNGRFTTARSAAEFVRMFVSDHSPLVIDFDVA